MAPSEGGISIWVGWIVAYLSKCPYRTLKVLSLLVAPREGDKGRHQSSSTLGRRHLYLCLLLRRKVKYVSVIEAEWEASEEARHWNSLKDCLVSCLVENWTKSNDRRRCCCHSSLNALLDRAGLLWFALHSRAPEGGPLQTNSRLAI